MSVINSIPLIAAGDDGYQISRSVRLRSSASAYLNRTPASAGSLTTWTLSGWVKRGALTSGGNFTLFSAGSAAQPYTLISFTSDQLAFDCINAGSVVVGRRYTNQVFRDPSAWYHLVFVWDTTNATAASRMRMYVNGVQVTSFSLSSDPALNATTQANTTAAHYFGEYPAGGNYLDGYMTEVNFVDGQALTPSSFGETDSITGVWKPKKYAGTYGTNGFYLNFSDNSAATAAAIGKDSSGNGNNWTPNNISVTSGVTYDSMIDTPTMYADGGNGRGNYCVYNPLTFRNSRPPTTYSSISNANLTATFPSGVASGYVFGSMYVSSGKWYWEYSPTTISGATFCGIDTGAASNDVYTNAYCYVSNGNKWTNGSSTAYGATYTTTNVIGVALDLDAGTLTFYKDGVSQGTAFTGISGSFSAFLFSDSGSVVTANFGQRPFAYTPPTGFKALNTQNLPDSTIKKGNAYFDVSTWTGNGSSQSIVNNGAMQPDFLWYKDRSAVSDHRLFDSVRGVTKALYSDATDAEATEASALTSFNSNGFTVGSGSGNTNTRTFVGWQWKESPSAGFDIVTYTGTGVAQNIAHSLGVAPRMIIAKRRNASQNWFVGHSSFASWASAIEGLNTTAAVNNGATAVFNSTAPTSSVFTVGTDLSASGGTYVAYLFSEVAGFSKFGSYTGNGSTDGPFVFCGHRPRFIMVKRTDAAGSWYIHDTARGTVNVLTPVLYADLSNAEGNYAAGTGFDVLSNGFKARTTNSEVNASGGTYIYAAFAENPFKYSLGR